MIHPKILRRSLLTGMALACSLSAQTDWTSYFGQGGDDFLLAMRTDSLGRVYVCGHTDGPTYIAGNGYQSTPAAGYDAFVACLDPRLPASQQLLWSTRFGGNGDDAALDLHVDPAGSRVTIVGHTTSTDLPAGNGWQTSYGGGARDGFAAAFDPTAVGAAQLLWATYLGGSGDDLASSVDEWAGLATIAGTTRSADFPTHAAWQNSLGGSRDLFVCRLVQGSSALFSTYLGGSGDEAPDFFGNAIFNDRQLAHVVTDPAGNVTVASRTDSFDYPNPNANLHGVAGAEDLVVSRFDPAGSSLLYSARIAGSQTELCLDLVQGSGDQIMIAAATWSTNFPTTPDALQSADGSGDGALVHLDVAQNQLLYATGLGGSANEDYVGTVYREPSGTYVLGGWAFSPNFPITAGAPQSQQLGAPQGYLARMRPHATGTDLQYATWFGGSISQAVLSIAPDGRGGAVAAGPTISPDLAVTANAFDPTLDGVRDGWIAVHHMLPTGMDRFGTATSPCGAATFLQVDSAPIAPNPGFAVETHEAPAGALGAVVLGAPMPGGTTVFNAAVFVTPPGIPGALMLADPSGYARQPLPLPAGLTWNGQLAMQSFWLNPGSCAAGLLTASNALR